MNILHHTIDLNKQIDGNISAANRETFERIWRRYPRRVGKSAAARAFERIPQSDWYLIEFALIHFGNEMSEREPRYIPHAATWLNQRRYEYYRPAFNDWEADTETA